MFQYARFIRCGISRLVLLSILSVIAVTPAMAERSAGVVAGVSASPNQFYVGGNVMAGKVAKDFWFRPSAEVGFGSHATLVALNGEFAYLIDLQKSAWTAYFGGGPALNIATIRRSGPGGNNTDAGGGFNFLGGIRKPHGVFAEIKAGLMDSPGFKFGVGYSFR